MSDSEGSFEVIGDSPWWNYAVRLRHFLLSEWRQLGCCLVVGLVLATMPNWMTLIRSGSSVYLADEDEVECYAPALAQAFERHPWTLGDPALAEGGESLYPRLQMVPAVLLAKALGLEPIDILFLWRIFSGLSLSLVLYLLARDFLGNPNWAMVLTVLLLSDQGMVEGQPLRLHIQTGWHLFSGNDEVEAASVTRILRHFRLITPGVNWVYLGACVLAMNRLLRVHSNGRFWLASASFGLLFYVYFYYWVAVAAALGLAVLMDFRRWRVYAGVLLAGGALGVPALIANVLTKATAAEGWLDRLQLFSHGHTGLGFVWPKVVAVLLLVCAGFVWRRHRDLLFIWCLVAVAMALSVHERFTGIIMQNWHYSFIWGPLLCLLSYGIMARELQRSRLASKFTLVAGVGLAAFLFLTGLTYRGWEVVRNRPVLELADEWKRYRSDQTLRQALSPQRGVLAGDRSAIKFAVFDRAQRPLAGGLVYSHSISNRQWDERRMLDLFVSGVPVERAVSLADGYPGGFWAAASRDEAANRAKHAEFALIYQKIASDPFPWLVKYGVTQLVLPLGQAPPANLQPKLRLVANGKFWDLWGRRE